MHDIDVLIGDIRNLLTTIKQRNAEVEAGTNPAIALAMVANRLRGVQAELERITVHMHDWVPGPSETKEK